MMLTNQQKSALLDLYKEEIVKRLTPFYNINCYEGKTPFDELLKVGELRQIIDDSESEKHFCEQLWQRLLDSPMKNILYDVLLSYLQDVEHANLHSVLCMVTEEDRRSQFRKVLGHLDTFYKFVDPDTTLEFFGKIPCYVDKVTKIKGKLEGVEDVSLRRKIIIRTLGLLGVSSFHDLLRAIYDVSEESKKFVETLYPNFLRYYELVNRERSNPRGIITVCPTNTSVEAILNAHQNGTEVAPFNIDLCWEGLPRAQTMEGRLLETIDNKIFSENPIMLRHYQRELCEEALKGKNVIVTAPTGSGKTMVAAEIIKQHMEQREKQGKSYKVLFMAPNAFILEQQAVGLKKCLGHKYDIAHVSGADNIPIRELIAAKDILVTTPQLIVNLLKESDGDGITDKFQMPFHLTTFSIIVFDECHNTKKSSPYSVLMQYYHRMNFSGKRRNDLPQIIGLTASLGVGKATDVDAALSHIVSLCAMLDSKVISVVKRHKEQLMKFSPITPDELRRCTTIDRKREAFRDIIIRMMTDLENHMYKSLKAAGIQVAASSSRSRSDSDENIYESYLEETDIVVDTRYNPTSIEKSPADKTSQAYLGWISVHIRRVVPETHMKPEVRNSVMEVLKVLEMLYRAFELFDNFTSIVAMEYIDSRLKEKEFSNLTKETRNTIHTSMPLLKEQLNEVNSMIAEVVKQLCLTKLEKSDFRAIIFVKTRESAAVLARILDANEEMKKLQIAVEHISGLNATTSSAATLPEDKTNKTNQKEKLDRFANGTTRVLVATSVAEEGLDIANCNMVIKYNYATNEIAHVQRRGRGRAENSSCILITHCDALISQEEKNAMKERLMSKALDAIEANRFDLAARVEEAIRELMISIQRNDSAMEERVAQQRSAGIKYNLLCNKCDAKLCTSDDIKSNKESQYCVCTAEFWAITKSVEIDDEKKCAKFAEIANLYCQCRNALGKVVRIDGVNMPALAAKQFVLEFTSDGTLTRKAVKQWKQVTKEFFTPEPLRNLDLATMQKASQAPSFRSDPGVQAQLSSILNQ